MARVHGIKGTLTFPTIGHPDTAGYVRGTISFSGDKELNNEFGDGVTWKKFIRNMSSCKGSFEAFYDSTFAAAEVITAFATPGATTDGTFIVALDTDATPDVGFTFPALLDNIDVEMTATGFHRVTGSYESSGAVTVIT